MEDGELDESETIEQAQIYTGKARFHQDQVRAHLADAEKHQQLADEYTKRARALLEQLETKKLDSA